MAHAGQVIHNPKTGETVTFLQTAADTGGRLLRLEMTAERASAPGHRHPRLTERWELQEGRVRFHFRAEERLLEAPAELVIPRDTTHWFESEGPIRTIVDYEPAGRFEGFLETVYALAADGKTNEKGMPNLLRSAVLGQAYGDDYALPFPPLGVQRVLFAVLAPVGRLVGYRARYVSGGS
jgi:mannose-6-phosphate isomerase-like protein (cupin superfamily)